MKTLFKYSAKNSKDRNNSWFCTQAKERIGYTYKRVEDSDVDGLLKKGWSLGMPVKPTKKVKADVEQNGQDSNTIASTEASEAIG